MKASRRSLRRGERGAAMVEAGVVLPVLAVFFGMLMYVHNAYLEKLTIQHETRETAFTNAAHACTDLGWESVTQRLEPPDVPKEGNPPDDDKRRSLDTVPFIMNQANTTSVAVALGRSKKVTAQSKFYCNPWVVAFYDPPGKHARTLQYLAAGIQAGMWKMLKFAGWSLQYIAQWTNGIVTE